MLFRSGCTHFPALANTIGRVAGAGLPLVDSAATTAEAVEALLREHKLARAVGDKPGAPIFLATDAPERFARVGEIFLGAPIDLAAVTLVDLQTIA